MIVLLAVVCVPLALVCGPLFLAARDRPRLGAALSGTGLVILALIAAFTHEDGHYDEFGSLLAAIAGVPAGALLIFGLNPATPWLLRVLGRNVSRLPPAVRPAARHLAARPSRTAPGVATTMTATAVAVAVMIITFALSAQARAYYQPEAPPGALVVEGFSPEDEATLRAAILDELPGAPIVRNNGFDGFGLLQVKTPDSHFWEDFQIGDEALLRYLTGDPATPYDQGTIVMVAADDEEVTSAQVESVGRTRTLPMVTVRPADPRMAEVFIPAKVVQNLGLDLEPEQLIIDPSLHRTTPIEQERLDRRLGDLATTHLEQGHRSPTAWLYVVAAAIPIALIGTLATISTAGSRRVLLRAGGPLRSPIACRAAFATAFGTVLGTLAGCAIGLLLAWPMTTSIEGDPPPRVSFETPWTLIAALVIGLPALAAGLAALAPRRRRFGSG